MSKTKATMDIFSDFRNFCSRLEFDLRINEYRKGLFDWKRLDNIFVLRNQFFYINDFITAENIYVHPNAEVITGYKAEEFHNINRIYDLMHPDDRDFVFEFSLRTIAIGKFYKDILKDDPLHALFSIDFRMKNKDGYYLKISRQTSCFRTDREGNMVSALVLFTDVTHLGKNDSNNIYFLGDDKNILYYDDLLKKYGKDYKISAREKQILHLIADGYSAPEIAEKLYLSVHTVISHKKNLFIKTGTKNVADLTRFASEKALL